MAINRLALIREGIPLAREALTKFNPNLALDYVHTITEGMRKEHREKLLKKPGLVYLRYSAEATEGKLDEKEAAEIMKRVEKIFGKPKRAFFSTPRAQGPVLEFEDITAQYGTIKETGMPFLRFEAHVPPWLANTGARLLETFLRIQGKLRVEKLVARGVEYGRKITNYEK